MKPIGRRLFILVGLVLLASGAWGMKSLTPNQKERLKSLAEDTRVKTERVRSELMRARFQLMEAYRAYDIDERKARAASERIQKAQLELLNLHLEDQIELRRILNAEQFTQFRSLMRQRFGRFHGPEGGAPEHFVERKALGEVDMTPDQKRRLGLPTGIDSDFMRILAKLRKDSGQLVEMYSQYDLDEKAARKLIDSIHSSQRELATLQFKFQQQIRSVLTQSQFEKYRQAIEKRLREGPWRKPPREFR